LRATPAPDAELAAVTAIRSRLGRHTPSVCNDAIPAATLGDIERFVGGGESERECDLRFVTGWHCGNTAAYGYGLIRTSWMRNAAPHRGTKPFCDGDCRLLIAGEQEQGELFSAESP
jgi:hypothetical protein